MARGSPLIVPLSPQAKQEQAQGPALCGRVTIPCPPGHGQAHRVLLTPDLLQHLRQHFVA